MCSYVVDVFEHVAEGAEWRAVLERLFVQIHLRMVSCCQIASKLVSHYKVLFSVPVFPLRKKVS